MVSSIRRFASCFALALFSALPGLAQAGAQPGVQPGVQPGAQPGAFKVMDGPLGGKIYYGSLAGQLNLQMAANQMMQRISQQFRARPRVNKVLKIRSGELVAVFFSVDANPTRKKIGGLLIVYVASGQPARAAVMVDDAARFRVSWMGMLKRLQSAASGSPESTALAALAGPTDKASSASPSSPGQSASAQSSGDFGAGRDSSANASGDNDVPDALAGANPNGFDVISPNNFVSGGDK
jgi:hypothetical protein